MPQNHQRDYYHTGTLYKMYVETIGQAQHGTCVFIPGAYHTGVCYLRTPDGRLGWAELAANQGYLSMVTDIPGTGRSGAVAFESMNSVFIIDAYKDLIESLEGPIYLFVHSMSGYMGFLLAEKLPHKIKKVVAIEPSLIGNVQEIIKPDLETTGRVKLNYRGMPFDLNMQKYGLVSETMVDRFCMLNAEINEFPNDKKSLTRYKSSLQPQHPRLFYELFNVRGSKPSLKDFSKLKDTKILIVTTRDPLHVNDDKKITKILAENNIEVEHWKEGIHGTQNNGHMMMIEKNNHLIFSEITNWLQETVK